MKLLLFKESFIIKEKASKVILDSSSRIVKRTQKNISMRNLTLCIALCLGLCQLGNSTNPLIFDLGPDVSFCEGDSVVLTVPLAGDSLSFLWSTGAVTQSITVFDAGNYSVEVTTPFCSGTDDVNITTLAAPIVDFEAEDACFGDPVTITNNSTNEPGANYLLELGNGSIVNAEFASIDYLYGLPNGTQYTLQLTITNPNGCTAMDTTTVEVQKQPFAFIAADDGCANGATVITNQTIDTVDASYVLDYGDGGFSFEDYFDVINYVYDDPGFYQVSMFVQNGNGCASDHFTFTSVSSSPEINQFNTTTNCFGDSTVFTTNATFNAGATFTWDFGDGNFSNSTNLEVKHLYEDNGASYDATLIIKNNNSVCSDTAIVPVEVLQEPLGDFEVSGGCFGEPIEIVNNSTGLSPDALFQLTYGDGDVEVVSDFTTITHDYTESGLFDLVIAIDNGNGCLDTENFVAGVSNMPPASFTGLELEYCLGDPQDTLWGVPAGGMFTGVNVFDDPYFSDNQGFLDPSVPAEDFFVYYTFVDPLTQCSSVDSQIVVSVNDLPDIDIDGVDLDYCEGGPIDTLFGEPAGGIFTGPFITDDIGAGDGFGIFRPLNDGEFVIAYSYVDDNGCANAMLTDIIVKKSPEIEFDPDTVFINSGEVLTISGGSAPNWSYSWSTGATTPSIDVSEPGQYVLLATDLNTLCERSDTLDVLMATGVGQVEETVQLKIFPNPFVDDLFIECKGLEAEQLEFQLISVDGKIIERWLADGYGGNELRWQLSTAHLESGIYYLVAGTKVIPLVKP